MLIDIDEILIEWVKEIIDSIPSVEFIDNYVRRSGSDDEKDTLLTVMSDGIIYAYYGYNRSAREDHRWKLIVDFERINPDEMEMFENQIREHLAEYGELDGSCK